MTININFFKIGLFILFIVVFGTNSYPQTIIYQTGFENIKDTTMLGKSLANDGWIVNDSSVQSVKPSNQGCFIQLRLDDKFRNAWCVSDAWDYYDDSTSSFSLERRPIQHKTLSMTAYWGMNGTTYNELEVCFTDRGDSIIEIDPQDGSMNYFTDLITDRWAYRVIPTNGYDNITLSFEWRCGGQANTDYGQIGYSTDGGTTWTWLTTGGTANGLYYGQQIINQNATISLPAACNNQNDLAIGFRFKCAGNGANQDLSRVPGFLIDNVVVKGTSSTCKAVVIKTQPANAVACNTGLANFSVTATGDTTIFYQWQVGPAWTNLTNNAMYSGTATPTLTVANPTSDLRYRCIASNCSPLTYATSDTASLTLVSSVEVNPPFHNQNQCLDSSVAFTLNPTAGTGPFNYQWMLNGKTISGATSFKYQISAIKSADSGNYSCIITNACNSVTGDVVSLTPIICNRTHHKITGYVTYDNGAKTPLSSKTEPTTTNIYLFNSGDTLIEKVQTDDNGYYAFINIINGTYYISGFTKKTWGGSNPTDALIVNRDYIGMYHFTDSLLWHAGDVDSNNRLNPTDALIINRRYIGLYQKYPKIGDWKFQKIKVEMDGADISQDIKAVCSGDVNASYAPYLIPQKIIYTPINNIGILNISPSPSPSISLSLSLSPFDIPVYLNDIVELGAIGLKFKVQSSKFKVIGIKTKIDGLIYNINDDGVNMAWAAVDEGLNVNPIKPLFYITAVYNGEPNLSNFQLPSSCFQLSSESELADINANIISTDKLFIPQLNISFSNLQIFKLSNYPNPFNNTTNIVYTLPEDLNVKMDIYNVLGENITTLVNTNQQVGQYIVNFDGSNLRQGIYFCRIEATNNTSAYNKTNIMMITR